MSLKINGRHSTKELNLQTWDYKYAERFKGIERDGDPRESAREIGEIVRKWRKIDNHLSKQLGRPLHRYCGCDAGKLRRSEEKVVISSFKGKVAILYSWPFGGGHDVVQRAIGERLAQAGMHVYNVDSFASILRKFDLLFKLSCGAFSVATLTNYLIRNKYWRTITVMNWLWSGESNNPTIEKIDAFRDSMIERGGAHIIVTCFDRFLGPIERAAAEERIPLISFAADPDPRIGLGTRKPEDIANPRLLRSIMFPPAQDFLGLDSQAEMGKKRVVFGGMPVRAPFLKKYTSEEIEALRQKWGIDDAEKRVLVLMSGGEGADNPFAELLLRYYSDQKYPLHAFVICGRNEARKIRLEEELSHLNNDLVAIRVLGWANEDEVGELEAMAADDARKGAVFSAKGGGGTLSESMAICAPLLVLDANPIWWEQSNIAFVCRHGYGMSFQKPEEFLTRLSELLRREYRPTLNYCKEVDSRDRSLKLIEGLFR